MSAVDRRDRAGVISNVLGGITTDVLTDQGDVLGENLWTLDAPTNIQFNSAKTNPDHLIRYETILHASATPNGKLLIYCHGHESFGLWDVGNNQSQSQTDIDIMIAAFPDYDILQCFMFAYQEATDDVGGSKYRNRPFAYGLLSGHDRMNIGAYDQMIDFHTRHFFAAVNTFAGSYTRIFMAGFSGGGTMSLWMGGLEARIHGVFPMVGYQPDWLAEGTDPLSVDGDAEQVFGPQLFYTSRVGMAALANWHHVFWNDEDTVIKMDQLNATRMDNQIAPVSSNFRETVTSSGVGHFIDPAWLPLILSDMDAL